MASPPSRRAVSLPSLAASSSPFAQPLNLVTADVTHRRVLTEAVGGGDAGHGRKVKVLHNKRMPFMAFERGIEWDRPHVKAQLPKDPLQPLNRLIAEVKAMNLEPAERRDRAKPKRHAGGVPPKMAGGMGFRTGREDGFFDLRRCGVPTSTLERLNDFGGGGGRKSRSINVVGVPGSLGGTGELRRGSKRRASTASSRNTARGLELPGSATGSRRPSMSMDVASARTMSARAMSMSASLPGSPTRASAPTSPSAAAQAAEALPERVEDIVLPFPWSDDELRSVFDRFDTDRDSEVHKDDLPAMLRFVGARPAYQEAMRIADSLTKYATLNFEEFADFFGKFREMDVEMLRQEFKAADQDGSGTLDFDELYALLHRLGYSPTHQSTREAFETVDDDGNGCVDFREFELLREHLRKTEGMTKADVSTLRTLYDKTIMRLPDGHRELVADEVWRILAFLGYSTSVGEVRRMEATYDTDGNGEFSFQELLRLVRTVRDMENDKVAEIAATYGSETETCPVKDLGNALSDLGYYVSEETIAEIVAEVSDAGEDGALDVTELGDFLRKYREVEGFTTAEVQELEDAFQREGKNGSLRTLDVGRVLRWYGFTRTVQQVQNLVSWIDLDQSGELEFDEFIKLMRRMHQDEARARFDTFKALENTSSHRLAVASLSAAVVMLHGVEPSPERLQEALGLVAAKVPKVPRRQMSESMTAQKSETPKTLSFVEYEAFFHHYRQLVVEEIHSNAGYSAVEVAKLRATFESYDKDGGGSLERAEMMKLIAEYFPDATKSKAGQRDIQNALAEIDGDGNGELDFNEFLRLMRKCDDTRDAKDLKLELEVVEKCRMGPEEVEGFRLIFSEYIDWKGEMDLDTLIALLSKIVEMTKEAPAELAKMVRDLHPQGREVARFPQFLQLIQRLTQENYLRVNDLASRAMHESQKEQQTASAGKA